MAGIAKKINELGARNEAALVAYVMTGYPNISVSKSAIRGAIRGGADIIELGYPFSDPLADGTVIQNAATVSLNHGMNIRSYIKLVESIQKITNIPLISMTYSNIFEHHGFEKLIKNLKSAGINGIILPDMPVDESKYHVAIAHKQNMETVFLASPNTSSARLTRIAAASSGFVYLVGVYGTTGQRQGVAPYTLDAIRAAKRTVKKTPVGVGFGISTPNDVAKCVRAGADAVIVGSSIVKMAANTQTKLVEKKIATYVASLKRATKNTR